MKNRIFQKNIFSYALIVFLVATYSLPVEAHLNICIGDDGHFEIGAVTCQPDQIYSQSMSSALIDDHHNDCIDYEPSCESNFICEDSFISSSVRIKNLSLQHTAYLVEQYANETYASKINKVSLATSYPHQTDPSPKILRSTILLI